MLHQCSALVVLEDRVEAVHEEALAAEAVDHVEPGDELLEVRVARRARDRLEALGLARGDAGSRAASR